MSETQRNRCPSSYAQTVSAPRLDKDHSGWLDVLLWGSLLVGVGWRQRPVSALKSFSLFKQASRVNSQRLSGTLVGKGAS